MRTTLTLDEDVARKIKAIVRQSGRPFKQVINESLRIGLSARKEVRSLPKFQVQAKDLGELPGINYDNIGELLEQVEGPTSR